MLILRTLGGLALERDGALLEGVAAQPSRLMLLAVLARAGTAGMTRDKVQALLWPEKDTAHARSALRQAIYALRRALGCVILGGWELRLDDTRITSDIGDFVSCIRGDDLETAVAWYHGPFLDGFFHGSALFERWAERERKQLSQLYASALERLAMRATSPHGAVMWWGRLVDQDPCSPRAVLRLMEALVRDGDPFMAIRCAREHALLVREEFDSPPDAAVQTLAERLLRQGNGQLFESVMG